MDVTTIEQNLAQLKRDGYLLIQRWCDEQAHEDLHPLAGDAVVFFSHIPHQGAKFGIDPVGQMRVNIVLHYQQNPMFPSIRFVSDPQFTLETLGYRGTFPFFV